MIVRELLTALGFKSDEAAVNRYDKAINGILTITGLVTAATIAMGAAILKGAGEMEQTSIAFETMLGSAEKADELIREITEFAAKTPFELVGLVESSKKLLAFGFAQEEIIDTMRNMGNIAAGIGRDKLPSLILALGKIRTKGKATMEELNIMLEAGVPILDELAKNMGVTKEEIFKLVSAGKVGFDDVNNALYTLSNEGGRFAGLMEKQSKSLLGIISNIGDFITNLSNDIGKELLPEVKSLARGFLDFLEANKEIIKTNLVKYFKEAVRVIAFVFLFLKKLYDKAIKPLLEGFDDITGGGIDLIKIFKMIGKIIGPVVRAVGKLAQVIGGLISYVSDLFEEFDTGNAIIGYISKVFELFGAIINEIAELIKFLEPVLKPILRAVVFLITILYKAITWILDKIIGEISGFSEKLEAWWEIAKTFWEALKKYFTDLWEAITKIFNVAFGAIKKVFDDIGGFITDIGEAVGGFFGGLFGGKEQGGGEGNLNNPPPPSLSGGTTNIDINSNVTIPVPEGTPEYQQRILEERARDVVKNEWDGYMREALVNYTGGE